MLKKVVLVSGQYVGNLLLTKQGLLFQPRSSDLSSEDYGIDDGPLFFPIGEISKYEEKSRDLKGSRLFHR